MRKNLRKKHLDLSIIDLIRKLREEEERFKRRITRMVKEEKVIDMFITLDQNIYYLVRLEVELETEDNTL